MFEEAIIHYGIAIKNAPKSAIHFNNRGLAHYHMGNFDVAKTDFNAAIDVNTENDPVVYFNRGNVLLNLKEFSAALADYDTAI